MTDNTESTIAMTAGARSAALIDEDIACAVPELSKSYSSTGIDSSESQNQRTGDDTLNERIRKYYENLKDKVVTFMKENTSRQSTAETENKKD